MLTFKSTLTTVIVAVVIRMITQHYFSHDSISYEEFTKEFTQSCIDEGRKEMSASPQFADAIEPLCVCMTNNDEMQAALKEAYKTQNVEQAKANIKPIAERIAPDCLRQYLGGSH